MKTTIGVSTDKALAESLGAAISSPAVWKKRLRIPAEECISLAQKYNVSLDWLILGRRMHATGDPSEASDSVALPVLDMETFYAEERRATTAWSVPRAWLIQEGLEPCDTIIVRVVGDAMAGTISDGQLVIVDCRSRDMDGICLVRFGDSLRLKRVQRMGNGSWRISSDNQAYAPDIIKAGEHSEMIIGHCHAVIGRPL
jgi:hypothetical protein